MGKKRQVIITFKTKPIILDIREVPSIAEMFARRKNVKRKKK